MSSVTYLARQFSIREYLQASSSTSPIASVRGFVYVETDRELGPQESSDMAQWARGPLDEIAFLKRIVEGTPAKDQDEGFEPGHGDLMKGAVIWAPLNRGLEDARAYVKAARGVAGERTWERIKGFRFLLQGVKEKKKFEELVTSDGFVQSLREMGKFWSFDVGVDQRQGGVWQLEMVVDMIERVRGGVPKEDQVVFILSRSAARRLRGSK
jgi:L-rhamnono-1,4-lactonase